MRDLVTWLEKKLFERPKSCQNSIEGTINISVTRILQDDPGKSQM
jgi:hypothetical protein